MSHTRMPAAPTGTATSPRHAIAFALALLFGQWLLLANPGWFSHDELGWAALADVGSLRDLPWQPWLGIDHFQYRPLTFNLWLLLSHALHDSPHLFHGLWVALGSLLAWLLRQTLRRCGASATTASVAAVVFALNPYAASVHGWVATLADLLWVGSGLALAFWLCGARAQRAASWKVFVIAAATALVALSAKEAGVVLAALAWLGWWLLRRPRHWLWAACGLTFSTVLYLLLRLDTILYQPRADDAYAWSLATLPANWLAYHLYALMPATAEVVATFQASLPRRLLAASVWLAIWASLARIGWRWLAAVLVGAALTLGPVLILQTPYNQYAYGASALLVALLALAWPRLHGTGRALLVLAAMLSSWHGLNVQRLILRVGELESRFTPSLRAALAAHPGRLVRVSIERPGDAWIYARLAHDPLPYGGATTRLRFVAGDSGSDYRTTYNGQVVAVDAARPQGPER